MALYEYVHGGNHFDENGLTDNNIIDFSVNINPLGISSAAVYAAQQAVAYADAYPDFACRRLTAAIAGFEGVRADSILCAGGASDLIFRAVYAIKPKKMLITTPSFSEYERAGKSAGAEILFYSRRKEDDFKISSKIVQAIHEKEPGMVFICNPNNPTGALTNLDTIHEIGTACRRINAVLFIDECFLDFMPDTRLLSGKVLLNEYQNIVVVKAFTKIFAMPGLRLGYAISENESLLDRLRYAGADWAVSNVAQAAGVTALLNCKEYIVKTVQYIRRERERMIRAFSDMGLTVYASSANFIFFHCGWHIDLHDALQKKGFRIRDCRNFKGLEPGYCRVAVLSKDKNTRLIEAMISLKR